MKKFEDSIPDFDIPPAIWLQLGHGDEASHTWCDHETEWGQQVKYTRAALSGDSHIESQEINLISKLGLKPYPDGNMWCFLWGDDLQSGIAGFGETVQLAVYDFNKNYASQRLLFKNPNRANSPQLVAISAMRECQTPDAELDAAYKRGWNACVIEASKTPAMLICDWAEKHWNKFKEHRSSLFKPEPDATPDALELDITTIHSEFDKYDYASSHKPKSRRCYFQGWVDCHKAYRASLSGINKAQGD